VSSSDLKPRTVGEILDASFSVYRRQFTRLALVAIVVSAPAIVIAAVYSGGAAAAVREFSETIVGASKAPGNDPWKLLEKMVSAYGKLVPAAVLATFLQALSRAGVAAAMAPVALAAVRRAPPPTITEIARAALPRIAPVLLVQLVFDVCWSSFACCCPPIMLFVGVALAPVSAILVLERGAVESGLRAKAPAVVASCLAPFAACLDATARAARLSWSAMTFVRAVACFLVLLSFVWIAAAAATTPLSIFAPESGSWYWVQHLAEVLILPVLGLGRALWYFDLVARREGADLEPAT